MSEKVEGFKEQLKKCVFDRLVKFDSEPRHRNRVFKRFSSRHEYEQFLWSHAQRKLKVFSRAHGIVSSPQLFPLIQRTSFSVFVTVITAQDGELEL